MIGMWNEFSQDYLMFLMIGTSLAFSIPIFFFPLTWAKIMKWTIPEQTDLVLYFGRCLGSLALVLEFCTFQAATIGTGEVLIFQYWIGICSFMVGLHIYGAIKHIQPIIETIEIGLWVVLLFLSLAFYPEV
ncbi:MAG TPA: hypothetical protein DCZ48_14415 [Methylococcaceae bacterium]|nr:hypothetical protein [Methylococcaceae bacterium]